MQRKKITAVALAAAFAGSALGAPVALATIDDGPGRGNPATNESGKCPPGQNKDTSVGGLKKC